MVWKKKTLPVIVVIMLENQELISCELLLLNFQGFSGVSIRKKKYSCLSYSVCHSVKIYIFFLYFLPLIPESDLCPLTLIGEKNGWVFILSYQYLELYDMNYILSSNNLNARNLYISGEYQAFRQLTLFVVLSKFLFLKL